MKQKRMIKGTFLTVCMMMVMMFLMTGAVSAAVPKVEQKGAGQTNVKIEWQGIDGVGYYGVQIASDANFTTIVKQERVSSSWTSDTIYGLVAGSTYYARVGHGSAYDNCYSDFSTPIQVVTSPKDVDAVNFVNASTNKVTLSWPASTGATAYQVTYNGQKFFTDKPWIVLNFVDGKTSASVSAIKKSSAGYSALSSTYGKSIYGFSALTTKISTKNFGFTSAYCNINVFYVGAKYQGHGFQMKGSKADGKSSFKAETTYGSIKVEDKFKYNTGNRFKVRAYVTLSDGTRKYGSWSSYHYFVNPKQEDTTCYSKSKKIYCKWPKLKQVSKIKVSVSTKEKSGYKTFKTLKGTKTSCTINKYNKKSLKKGKKYYVKITYYVKSGSKSYKSDVYNTYSGMTVR